MDVELVFNVVEEEPEGPGLELLLLFVVIVKDVVVGFVLVLPVEVDVVGQLVVILLVTIVDTVENLVVLFVLVDGRVEINVVVLWVFVKEEEADVLPLLLILVGGGKVKDVVL